MYGYVALPLSRASTELLGIHCIYLKANLSRLAAETAKEREARLARRRVRDIELDARCRII